jgi:hypothetical protein
MKKFTTYINESLEATELEEIEDTLLHIIDTYGKPQVTTASVGDRLAYILRWDLNFSLNEYHGPDVLEKINQLFECLVEAKKSQGLMENFKVEFKISNFLFVRLTPKSDKKSESYTFIKKIHFREIELRYGQIAKFFMDRDCDIINITYEDEELNQTSGLNIAIKGDTSVCNEFIDLIRAEFESRKNEIDREIDFYITGGNVINIIPTEEKCYVTIDKNI